MTILLDAVVYALGYYRMCNQSLFPFQALYDNRSERWFVSDQLGDLTKENSLFSVFKLQAKRKGIEVIEHQGCDVETLKVLVRLTGLRSALWKAEYWYRPSDGIMLRYEAVRGGPRHTENYHYAS